MADFKQKKSFKSRESLLVVDGGLPPGTYVFQLEVEDESGNKSKAAKIKMKIVEAQDPVRPPGGNDRIVVPPVNRGSNVRRRRPGNP